MSWEHLTRAATLTIEYFLREPDNARRGQVLIADATGFNFSIFRSYAISQYIASIDIFLVSIFTSSHEEVPIATIS